MDKVSEIAFKRTFAATNNDEIAADVSDDLLLIAGALLCGYEDDWLNALWLSYRAGRYPHKPLHPLEG